MANFWISVESVWLFDFVDKFVQIIAIVGKKNIFQSIPVFDMVVL